MKKFATQTAELTSSKNRTSTLVSLWSKNAKSITVFYFLFAFLLTFLTGCSSDNDSVMQPTNTSQSNPQQEENDDDTAIEYTCGNSDHPKVGQMAIFNTHHHQVAGQATIIDNCTIEVTSFSYDGEGPTVYFYGGLEGDYSDNGAGFILSMAINGRIYDNETYTITLTSASMLDEMDGISVWCSDFQVSFGDGLFM